MFEHLNLDKERKLVSLFGEPVIFHCHHYNLFLQQTIEDPGYIDGAAILQDSAQEISFSQLRNAFSTLGLTSVEEKFSAAAQLFTFQGFGRLEIEGDASGGAVRLYSSHYAQGWTSKYSEQILRQKPLDHFAVGFVAALFDAVFAELGSYTALEEQCSAVTGKEPCLIQVSRAPKPRQLSPSPGMGKLIDDPVVLSRGETNVDYNAVNEALWGLPLEGSNDDGLIRAFNVLLTRMPANYYNRIQYRFMVELGKVNPALDHVGKELIRESGHVCAFYTFGNIMESVEWDAVVGPMLKTKEDWVHGIIAVASSLGWGRWEVLDVNSTRAHFAIDGNYETNYYIASYPQAHEGNCYLAQGGLKGTMNIIYNGNIEEKPVLDEAFYNLIFKRGNVFHSEEVKAREAGEPYCEFIVEQP